MLCAAASSTDAGEMAQAWNLGNHHYTLSQYDQALPHYQKALEIMEQLLPPNHLDRAGMHRNLGLTYHALQRYEEALPHYEEALKMYKHFFGIADSRTKKLARRCVILQHQVGL